MRTRTAVTTLLTSAFTIFAVATGCRDSGAAPSKNRASVEGAVKGNNYEIATTAEDCKVGADCSAQVILTATGAFHCNKEYPYKLTMAPDKAVEYLGKGEDKGIFSKANGDLAAEGEKVTKMTVKFKAKEAGNLVLKGTYKMSVCSESNCQLETKDLTIEVKAKR